MSTIINGTSSAITFPDSTIQNTSAVVSGKVPYSVLPTGSVLQVVYGSTTTGVTNNTSTPVSTGLTASITPKFSTSKILVIVGMNSIYKTTGNTGATVSLYRNAGSIFQLDFTGGANNSTNAQSTAVNGTYLDSPATTSSTSYTVYFASQANTAGIIVQNNGGASTITLMEIAG